MIISSSDVNYVIVKLKARDIRNILEGNHIYRHANKTLIHVYCSDPCSLDLMYDCIREYSTS